MRAPSLEEQRRIVAYLDGLQARVDALKQLQSQTQAELDALLPSVLLRSGVSRGTLTLCLAGRGTGARSLLPHREKGRG